MCYRCAGGIGCVPGAAQDALWIGPTDPIRVKCSSVPEGRKA
jgi:hypothetical protein